MALNYGYFNSVGGDRKYDAETMSSYFSGIISKGVLQNYANKFQVLAGSGMTVRVSTGKAYFTNGQWVENDAIINLTLDISSSLLSRIDRIVLRRDNSDSARNVSIVIKQGTPASNPTAPALTSTEYVEELSLCQILIGPNVTSISQSNITDERPNNSLCGFTHQLFEQVDTTDIFAQYDTAFNDWFTDIKETLSTVTLMRQYTNAYITETQDQTLIPIGISQFNINLDILNVFINGLKLVQGIDYTKSESEITLALGVDVGTQIEFEVFKSVDGSEAESVIDQVEELQNGVAKIDKFTYYCNGENDNKLLTEICEGFLESTGVYNNLSKLTIDVVGKFGVDSSVLYDGEEGSTYSMAVVNATTDKNLCLNFDKCDIIAAKGAFMYAQNITVKDLAIVHSNNVADSDMYSLSGFNATFIDCAVIGQYNGGTCSAMNLNTSKALNCTIDVVSAGLIYGFSGSNAIMDNCKVTVKSTALSAYGTGATSSRANNCNFKGITASTATDASGNGGIGGGDFSNCLFEGLGGLKGHGFYMRAGYLVNVSNCVFRGYTTDSTSGLGVGFITAAGDASTVILHGINCNQVAVTGYSQTASMNIAGGHGVYDGLFYTAPTIYDTANVVSHGSYNRNRV